MNKFQFFVSIGYFLDFYSRDLPINLVPTKSVALNAKPAINYDISTEPLFLSACTILGKSLYLFESVALDVKTGILISAYELLAKNAHKRQTGSLYNDKGHHIIII